MTDNKIMADNSKIAKNGYMEQLNEYQKAAVLDESNACLVNANVGSGKTTVLISKILYLHYQKKVEYANMVVLTFTNKAADEIRERLIKMEPELDEKDLQYFGTFHSVALHLLRDQLAVSSLGYSREFQVIEPEEELDMAMKVIRDHKLNIKYKNRLKKRLEHEKFNRYQDDLEQLRDFLSREKIAEDKMTFDDLIKITVQLLKVEASSIDSEKTALHRQWIIIDEVQDCDGTQLELIDALKCEDTSLFAVGDPNQVIYSWRGSQMNVFGRLVERYQATELSLPLNYRSGACILAASRRFLQKSTELTGARESAHKIVVRKQYDSFQEAEYLADKMKQLHEKDEIPYREMAVFYRLQNQSEIFEHVFSRYGIPYEVSVKRTIRDIPVLDWTMKILRYSMNSRDLLSRDQVLDHKVYGFAKNKAAKLERDLFLKKMNEFHHEFQNKFPNQFQSMFQENDQELDQEKTQALYDYYELDHRLHPISASYEQERAMVLELFQRIIDYSREHSLTFLTGMQEFISSSALYGVNILHQEVHNDQDSVKLMTLHASKGLEFKYVFITGVNYGLIPLRSQTFEEEDEERRLFFVGMTRAKDYLELSYYVNPDQPRTTSGPSDFIRRLPEDAVLSNEKEIDGSKGSMQDLQELKKMILAEKKEKVLNQNEEHRKEESKEQSRKELNEESNRELNEESSDLKLQRRVEHPKYGIGQVIKEDELMLTVAFEGYGQKEFMKGFSELKDL